MVSQGKGEIGTGKTAAACVVALLLLISSGAQAQTYTVLHNFTGVPPDGANPTPA